MQLQLFDTTVYTPKRTPSTCRTPEQETKFEAFLKDCRRESALMENIVKELFPDLNIPDAKLSLDKYKTVCEEFHKRYPSPHLEAQRNLFVRKVNKKQNPYRPWSLERKQKQSVQRLIKQPCKKWSFPEFWIEEVQNKLLANPKHYGVCPLPNVKNCLIFPEREVCKQQVINRENQLRKQENCQLSATG